MIRKEKEKKTKNTQENREQCQGCVFRGDDILLPFFYYYFIYLSLIKLIVYRDNMSSDGDLVFISGLFFERLRAIERQIKKKKKNYIETFPNIKELSLLFLISK